MALRWGICSAGKISNDFVVSLRTLPESDHKVVAVGARSLEAAKTFAATHSIPRAYGSYEEVAADPEVDVVYVGSINTAHLSVCMTVLEKGKPILCESPLTMNVRDTETLLKAAQDKGIFLMEALLTRYFPVMFELRKIIAEGQIGEVKYVNAAISFRRPQKTGGRHVDPKLGGGGLLSLGVYVMNFTSMVFGGEAPESIHAWGQLTEEGTDELAAITLVYKGGRIAQLTCGTAYNQITCEAVVCGTKGDVKIPVPFWCPTKIETAEGTKEFPLPEPALPLNFFNSTGMRYEAEEVRRCLREGKKESDIMPHKETLLVAKMTEEIMKQIGVVYYK